LPAISPATFSKKPFVVICFPSDFVKENPDLANLPFQRAAKYPISEEAWTGQLNAMRGFNTNERLQQIKVPTLILHGRKDVEITPENGSILAEAIPNAKLVYLEKSAHYLAEEMREVISLLIDFLA
jgi:3-oxoadipate enol-lactonase